MTPADCLVEWHRALRERDVPALAGLLAAEVEIRAPSCWARVGALVFRRAR